MDGERKEEEDGIGNVRVMVGRVGRKGIGQRRKKKKKKKRGRGNPTLDFYYFSLRSGPDFWVFLTSG